MDTLHVQQVLPFIRSAHYMPNIYALYESLLPKDTTNMSIYLALEMTAHCIHHHGYSTHHKPVSFYRNRVVFTGHYWKLNKCVCPLQTEFKAITTAEVPQCCGHWTVGDHLFCADDVCNWIERPVT